MKNEEKIVICDTCQGTGYQQSGDKCTVCDGHGRLLRRTTISDTALDEENLKRKAIYG